MTEQEKASFLRNAARAPGKRTIKPTQYFFNELPDGDEDDDNDFHVSGDENSGEEGSSSSGSSDNENDNNDNSDSENDSNEKSSTIELDEDTQDAKNDVEDLAAGANQVKKEDIVYCCICLKPETKELSVSKCDRCNIAVHDACYGVIDDDTESVASNGEIPWFCEPCMFGLVEPPHCELCPSRYGAFKKTDIGENWIHVLCGQYIPKITYADNEKLIGISYQEIDHKTFGKKPCSCCNDTIKARIGIAVPCEAGLCKNNYHITCAQRLGLLVELDESECTGHLFCKRHTLSEDLKRRKRIYDKMFAFEEKRMQIIKRRKIGENHRIQFEKQLADYNQRVVNLNNVNHPGPANAKRIRMIQTSAEIIEGFAAKAEMALGIDRDRYVKEFSRIPTENINLGDGLSFSDESARYFEYRENVLFDELDQYSAELKINKEEALQKIEDVKKEVAELEVNNPAIIARSKLTADLCAAFVDCLGPLGAKGVSRAFLRLPKKHPAKPQIKILPSSSAPSSSKVSKKRKNDSTEPPPKLQATPVKRKLSNGTPEVITLSDDDMPKLQAEVTTPTKMSTKENQKPRKYKTVPKMKKQKSSSVIEINSSSQSNDASFNTSTNDASSIIDASTSSTPTTIKKSNKRKSPGHGFPKICHNCQKDSDPHLMPFCDECKHFFHLSCLDPPLSRMPKTTRYYGWTCADCVETKQLAWEKRNGVEDEEEEETKEENPSVEKVEEEKEIEDLPSKKAKHAEVNA
uniref:PHD finger protein 14 n=1 Tax=Panagrolaimus superbus TaxID=310955 RepID=A0A914YM35_9BILA